MRVSQAGSIRAGHKWIRREFLRFDGSKRRYRYWYFDPKTGRFWTTQAEFDQAGKQVGKTTKLVDMGTASEVVSAASRKAHDVSEKVAFDVATAGRRITNVQSYEASREAREKKAVREFAEHEDRQDEASITDRRGKAAEHEDPVAPPVPAPLAPAPAITMGTIRNAVLKQARVFRGLKDYHFEIPSENPAMLSAALQQRAREQGFRIEDKYEAGSDGKLSAVGFTMTAKPGYRFNSEAGRFSADPFAAVHFRPHGTTFFGRPGGHGDYTTDVDLSLVEMLQEALRVTSKPMVRVASADPAPTPSPAPAGDPNWNTRSTLKTWIAPLTDAQRNTVGAARAQIREATRRGMIVGVSRASGLTIAFAPPGWSIDGSEYLRIGSVKDKALVRTGEPTQAQRDQWAKYLVHYGPRGNTNPDPVNTVAAAWRGRTYPRDDPYERGQYDFRQGNTSLDRADMPADQVERYYAGYGAAGATRLAGAAAWPVRSPAAPAATPAPAVAPTKWRKLPSALDVYVAANPLHPTMAEPSARATAAANIKATQESVYRAYETAMARHQNPIDATTGRPHATAAAARAAYADMLVLQGARLQDAEAFVAGVRTHVSRVYRQAHADPDRPRRPRSRAGETTETPDAVLAEAASEPTPEHSRAVALGAVSGGAGRMSEAEARQVANAYRDDTSHPSLTADQMNEVWANVPARGLDDLAPRLFQGTAARFIGANSELDTWLAARGATREELVRLGGVSDDARGLSVTVNGGNVSLRASFRPAGGNYGELSRYITWPVSGGRIEVSNALYVSGVTHTQQRATDETPFSGFKMLATEALTAKKLRERTGRDVLIRTHGAGDFSGSLQGGMNGYYSWPQLGMVPSGNLSHKYPQDSRGAPSSGRLVGGARLFTQIMSTAEGTAYYRVYGCDHGDYQFDTNPGSYSMKRLEWYCRRRFHMEKPVAGEAPPPMLPPQVTAAVQAPPIASAKATGSVREARDWRTKAVRSTDSRVVTVGVEGGRHAGAMVSLPDGDVRLYNDGEVVVTDGIRAQDAAAKAAKARAIVRSSQPAPALRDPFVVSGLIDPPASARPGNEGPHITDPFDRGAYDFQHGRKRDFAAAASAEGWSASARLAYENGYRYHKPR